MNIQRIFRSSNCVALMVLAATGSPEVFATRAHSGIVDLYGGSLSNSTCVRLADRNIQCWGDLFNGLSDLHYPGTIVDIALGDRFLCVLTNDGRVGCSGDNTFGQLGGGAAGGSSGGAFFAVQQTGFAYLQNVSQISAGTSHVCALKTDRTVWCWGGNNAGQLGNFTIAAGMQALATQVIINDSARHVLGGVDWISAGGSHTCAEFAPDAHGIVTAACWGYNAFGQLGAGTITPNENSPVTVSIPGASGPEALQISPHTLHAGFRHTCARIGDTGACWGDNSRGENSTGLAGNTPTPATVIFSSGTTVSNIAELTLGRDLSCLRFTNSSGACWGANDRGQLGNFLLNRNDSAQPAAIILDGANTLAGIMKIVSNHSHTCALTQDRKVLCWGDNSGHQLGASSLSYSEVPIDTGDGPLFTDDLEGG